MISDLKHMMKNSLLIIIIFLTLKVNAQETGLKVEHDATWQQILDKAKKENKYILLDAYASWCGPCKWMAKEVFPKPEVGAAINPYYISAKIDMEKGEGIELAKKYNVRNYPTYLFFDANGELVHRSLGSMPAKDFIELCTNTLNPDKQYITLQKKYLSGYRDTAFLKQFAYVASEAQDTLYKQALSEYFDANNKQLNSNTIRILYDLTSSLEDESFKLLQSNKEAFYKVIGKEEVDMNVEELVWNEAKRAGKKGTDKEAFKKVIQQYLPEKTDLLCAEYEISLLKRAGDWKEYLPKVLAFADKYCQNDWQRLNDIANNLLENYITKDVLQKALTISLQSVAATPNYINQLTTAQIYLKLKDKVNAKKYAAAATESAKDIPGAVDEVKEFTKDLK